MKRNKIFYFSILTIALMSIIDYSYYFNGLPLGFNRMQFVTAILESDHIVNAVTTFYSGIFTAVLILLGMIISIYLLRKYIKTRFLYIPLFLIPFSLLGGFIMVKKTNNIYNFFPFVKIPSEILMVYTRGMLNIPYCKREAVLKKPIKESYYKNIILFIDESVRADYLSVNGYKSETTPFLNSLKNLITLGSMPSVANNSHTSNYILRNGIHIDQLPDKSYATLKQPSIFQYAKKAGYKTIYVDAQVTNFRRQGLISSYDFEHIDTFLSNKGGVTAYSRDRKMIDNLSKILNNSEKKHFVYFVKFGSHWNYNFTYPKSEIRYKPVLEGLESMDFKNRTKSINTYKNSIHWGVDKFFKYTLDNLDMNNNLILYTSDHGQNLLENSTRITHGIAKNPPSTTAIVPLLLYANDIDYVTSKFNHIELNTYSQYQLFPSLLDLFGYDNTVINNYGKPFWKGSPTKQRFFSGSLFDEGFLNVFTIPQEEN
jgi:glucan phosphoethanolaminetransferase (alkaline phosphatase superfamily)